MGVGTILRAKKLVLMAWGENKAGIVAKAVEGAVTEAISASFLQDHPDARFFIDTGASRELTRFKLPWLVGPVNWNPRETQRRRLLAERKDEAPGAEAGGRGLQREWSCPICSASKARRIS